ncbi:hypothetical protein [Castellaniella sp.]|uniref:hypothetical protein n=1 Tax=Castellaniella sp. TaxID=1955812 RepID=UPI002AFE6955|nr:hypothetical protein [Castellaniella sp.]
MPIIPCEKNEALRAMILEFAEILRTQAHTLGDHGLSENEFYQSGLFRGAIERLRGQFSATMRPKREFVAALLSHMEDLGFIEEWISAGAENRHDYTVTMPGGRVCAIELKGCLDGNNTNIFERPPHADEFVIWSVCSNEGADPRHNVQSGIHTRLSAEIIFRNQRVDGLVVWDWICGTIGRPCPKVANRPERFTDIGPYRLPPPCIYMFPATVPTPRNNRSPNPQPIASVSFLDALNRCFGGCNEEVSSVRFTTDHRGNETVRSTRVERDGNVQFETAETPIRRA